MKMHMDISGLEVNGHFGTWHVIDHIMVEGFTFWLMEHDMYGDNAANVIVNNDGELVLDEIFNGFDDGVIDLLKQENIYVAKMPDDSITVGEMKKYGYSWGGMLPMRADVAKEYYGKFDVYMLYCDNTEGIVISPYEIDDHDKDGGIFGIEKVEWLTKQRAK